MAPPRRKPRAKRKRRRAGHRARKKRSITANPPSPARIVQVLFHSDRYKGTCELIDPDSDKVLYTSGPIRKISGENRWVCVFPDRSIPKSQYLLSIPLKRGSKVHKVYQRTRIDYLFENVDAKKTKSEDKKELISGARVHVLADGIIGDAYSLEEAVLHHFSHIYADNLFQLIKDSYGKSKKKPAGDFQTFVDIVKSSHDAASGMIGWIKADNEFFKTLQNLKDIYDDLWSKSNYAKLKESLEKSKLEDSLENTPVLSRYGLKEWQKDVDKATRPVAIVGKILKYMGCIKGFYDLFEATEAERTASSQSVVYLERNYKKFRSSDFRWSRFRSFNRTELTQATVLKQRADAAAGVAGEKGIQFTWEVASLFIGMMFPAGYIASFGKRAATFSKALDVVETGLKTMDSRNVNTYWSTTYREVMEYINFAFCQANNSNSINGMKFFRGYHDYIVQFLFRSKVLYGFLRLVSECGSYEDNPGQFKKNVGKLKINDYLTTLCLKPFWVSLDYIQEDWVDYYHLQKDRAKRDNVIRFQRPGDTKQWRRINFHRFYPIHYVEHKDPVELAKWFSVDYGGLSKKHIIKAYWEYARYTDVVRKKDGTIEVKRWRPVTNKMKVSSETPVRAIVLFTGHVRIGVPVKFQLERLDAADADGPSFYTTTRSILKADKLPSPAKLCAVKLLTHTYKGKLSYGLRPFKNWSRSSIAQPMRMCLKVSIGRGEVKGYIPEPDDDDKLLWSDTWAQEVTLSPFLTEGDAGKAEREKFWDTKYLSQDFD